MSEQKPVASQWALIKLRMLAVAEAQEEHQQNCRVGQPGLRVRFHAEDAQTHRERENLVREQSHTVEQTH